MSAKDGFRVAWSKRHGTWVTMGTNDGNANFMLDLLSAMRAACKPEHDERTATHGIRDSDDLRGVLSLRGLDPDSLTISVRRKR